MINNNFAWNDTIALMNKNNSIKSLMRKLFPMWTRNGRVQACIMYSTCNTVGFSNFKSLSDLEHYIDMVSIDMIYIKTNYGDWQVYLSNYDTYRFEDRKNYKLLKIIYYDNKEIDIKL